MLEDIATLTGGTAVMEELGIDLEKLELTDLGRAKKVTIDKDNTTIIEGRRQGADIKGRIEHDPTQIEATSSDYDREKLEERLAKLAGGVAQINVGAATEVEMKEKKARVEDALHACRAAVEEGILPGGGVAVLRARKALDALKQEGQGRRARRHRHRLPRRLRPDQADRRQLRPRRLRHRRQGRRVHRDQLRLQRPHPRVRRPRQDGRHRPHQGRTHRPPERREHRGLLLTTEAAIVELKEKKTLGEKVGGREAHSCK
jgi:hypothetical protein